MDKFQIVYVNIMTGRLGTVTVRHATLPTQAEALDLVIAHRRTARHDTVQVLSTRRMA